jgi:hydroxyacylglutathione hydrolase
MIVERSMNDRGLSNTYLVLDERRPAVVIDAGGPVEPLIDGSERWALTPSHVLLTHHHHDHVERVDGLTARWPGARS